MTIIFHEGTVAAWLTANTLQAYTKVCSKCPDPFIPIHTITFHYVYLQTRQHHGQLPQLHRDGECSKDLFKGCTGFHNAISQSYTDILHNYTKRFLQYTAKIFHPLARCNLSVDC